MNKVWCPMSIKPDKIEWANVSTKLQKVGTEACWRCCKCGNLHAPVR